MAVGSRLADIIPMRLATFVYPEQHPLAGRSGMVFGYAIRLEAAILLVDTGVAAHPDIDLFYRPQRRDIADALAAAGLSLERVVAVVNSHLHFDHCGQNPRFSAVPIHAQRSEHEAAHAPRYT
jgi:N-acyl homoserine lactone hydrolase